MKTHQIWRSIRRTGIHGIADEELVQRIMMVNTLSLSLCCLIFLVGSVYYMLSAKLSILIPAAVECVLAASAIVFNRYRYYHIAALVTFFVQCLASLYFGLLLGNVIELQAMVIFLFLITFLLFKNSVTRLVCLISAVVILVVIEGNYYFNFVKQVPLDSQLTVIFKALSIAGVLLVITVVGRPYVLSKDYLHKINHSKKIFIYQVTHELRTQLNAVYYVAQLIKREIRLDPHLKKIDPYIDLLFTVVGNTRNIINNVLDMSKIEAGKMEDVQEEAFEVNAFFERLIAVHKVTAKARNIQIQLHTDARLPPVIICDSFKLSQAVANLLSNAVKYADRNSTVHLKLAGTNAQSWNIQVINKGVGIEKGKLNSIFELFVTNKPNRYTESTGLGLFITRNMVQALQGNIQVESQLQGTTTFTIDLPLKPGKIASVHEGPEEDTDLSQVYIMVADDNEMNNILFSKYLSMCGCEVTSVSNGAEVLQQLQPERRLPDLILLDHQMPELDGAATLHHLKKDARLKNIPVIICTGSFEFQDVLIAAGASDIVIKPIDQPSLFQVIRRHLPHLTTANAGSYRE
ncbi:MAG TPA: hybrid sensor histidine kinase/response regulator [Chitinophaga sp.]|uniref:hybrid sensor histidine kinase/response regulator n=1 Tax=Chitinophaga sp. TaxID=1869181 RepID=UPI002DBD3E90|nr:hybrid sensor histidine kinase/response regulator [Chitinophaga sp.]HEU4552025.1 hybrid sensor histidine kinase/response regulator [Chitinophaga sp.]